MLHDLSKPQEADNAFQFITSEAARNSTIQIRVVKAHNQRSLKQNSALHKYFEILAEDLNNSGMYLTQVLRKDVDIPWTPELTKQLLWKPIQKAMLQKDSTAKLTTKELDRVYEVLNKHLAESVNVSVPFPSLDTYYD